MKLPVYIKGQGEPLLMIHGIISDGSFFEPVIGYLSDSFTCITYDRSGYGAADTDGDFSVSHQAELAADIIRENSKEPVWIFGNSAGGLITIELCLKYPELVRGIILLEPSFSYDEAAAKELTNWNLELNSYVEEKRIKKALTAFSRVVGKAEESGGTSLDKMKKVLLNLQNFMYGELNEVQHYKPELLALKSIKIPVRVVVTKDGMDKLFGYSSKTGADIIGWKTAVFEGNHNAVNLLPESSAAGISEIIKEFRLDYENRENI